VNNTCTYQVILAWSSRSNPFVIVFAVQGIPHNTHSAVYSTYKLFAISLHLSHIVALDHQYQRRVPYQTSWRVARSRGGRGHSHDRRAHGRKRKHRYTHQVCYRVFFVSLSDGIPKRASGRAVCLARWLCGERRCTYPSFCLVGSSRLLLEPVSDVL
jgi:hypothetical protein